MRSYHLICNFDTRLNYLRIFEGLHVVHAEVELCMTTYRILWHTTVRKDEQVESSCAKYFLDDKESIVQTLIVI